MFRQNLLIATFCLITPYSFAQIRLAHGFHCVLGENHAEESYFTDGTYSFESVAWGRSGIYGKDVTNMLETQWHNQAKFKRTSDGLYWATGKINGEYIYTVLVDDALQFTLRSRTNGVQFSNYSAWLLQQIRNNHGAGLENYFTDYRGKSCYGVR